MPTTTPRAGSLSMLLALAAAACGPTELTAPDGQRDFERSAGWTCDGTVGTTINPAGMYYTTSFGCWIDANGNNRGDPGDNCIPWCQSGAAQHDAADEYAALCGGMTGPQCERSVKWFAAGADRWGCASRLLVTNPDNGKAVVVAVLDRGPHCSIERRVDHWVADLSYPTSNYLFGGSTSATERADVIITEVPNDTPLGPSTGAPPPPAAGGCSEVLCDTDAAGAEGGTACYCDAACTELGDCCGNRDEVCGGGGGGGGGDPTPTFGCQLNLCGTTTAASAADGSACYCDDSCAAYGDCCANLAEVCGGSGGGGSTLPSGPAGLQGVVYYGSSGANRIANATITLSTGHTFAADGNGYFSMTGLPTGATTITASAPGWSTASVTRDLVAGELTWGSVRLQ
ncbi:MAG: carboxypeptidase regulatory-like domain-containing protein [Kofleriaceae bacterium]